jgi:enoyl-CoA hydratase/carnithine racemase
MTPTLTWDDKIAVVDLGEDENRFSPEFLDAINDHLDDVEKAGAHGLVTTARGKFYTNGLDLDWLGAHAEQGQSYVARVQALLARVLTFPTPTAAAVTGHAFGFRSPTAWPH